jgi:hypothetical protein
MMGTKQDGVGRGSPGAARRWERGVLFLASIQVERDVLMIPTISSHATGTIRWQPHMKIKGDPAMGPLVDG